MVAEEGTGINAGTGRTREEAGMGKQERIGWTSSGREDGVDGSIIYREH